MSTPSIDLEVTFTADLFDLDSILQELAWTSDDRVKLERMAAQQSQPGKPTKSAGNIAGILVKAGQPVLTKCLERLSRILTTRSQNPIEIEIAKKGSHIKIKFNPEKIKPNELGKLVSILSDQL